LNLRADGRPLRVGHKGAAALEPENTIRSLARAVELGADLVEFDVLDLLDGTLVLAHSDDLHEVSHGAASGRVRSRSLEELRRVAPELPTLDEALAFLSANPPGVGLHVDLKWHGYERSVVEALRRHGLVERTLVSTVHPGSLRTVAALEARLARGLTYPWDRHNLSRRLVLAPLTLGTLETLRRALPYRIGRLLERAQATAAVLQYRVVSRAVVRRCHALGAPVFAWTVDSPTVLRRLARAGVDGVVTNDPRIFASAVDRSASE
jgi:glycerophosphoryl diester phosphodiesterase